MKATPTQLFFAGVLLSSLLSWIILNNYCNTSGSPDFSIRKNELDFETERLTSQKNSLEHEKLQMQNKWSLISEDLLKLVQELQPVNPSTEKQLHKLLSHFKNDNIKFDNIKIASDSAKSSESKEDSTKALLFEHPKKEDVPPKAGPPACATQGPRDFQKEPLLIYSPYRSESTPINCDVPCKFISQPDYADTTEINSRSQCSYHQQFTFTMENIQKSSFDHGNLIEGSTHRSSDVPMLYPNWVEYNIMRPPLQKTQENLIVAIISNCGPRFRLEVLEGLQKHGVKVDSYGNCMRNKQIPQDIIDSSPAKDYGAIRTHLIRTYKFTASMENSAFDDYVTEKLYSTLSAGSVPLYHGAPNVLEFLPNNHSAILVNDFKTVEQLAEHLKRIGSDEKLYQHYLSWKEEGPEDHFLAVMNLGNVHSNCRLCIVSADRIQKKYGEFNPPAPLQGDDAKTHKQIRVRSRGSFYFRTILLKHDAKFQDLYNEVDAILDDKYVQLKEYLKKHTHDHPKVFKRKIYSMYTFPGKVLVQTDYDVSQIQELDKIEAILI